MKCSNCSFDNPLDARFCENCGRPIEHACPNCGQPISPGAKFFKNCGFQLTVVTAKTQALDALRQSAPAAVATKILAERDRATGERKLITALFADIVGSTSLADKLDPEDWREIVTGAHQRVSQAVYRYEGTIAQLLGDGVLAFFGAPLAHEDDAERAIRAALDMLALMQAYADELVLSGRIPTRSKASWPPGSIACRTKRSAPCRSRLSSGASSASRFCGMCWNRIRCVKCSSAIRRLSCLCW